jgi:chorismate dehydratase
LRIGCVKYLNARPLIQGWPGPVTLDHPSALCRKLAAGELDLALVSSFEFLRNPIYRIIDDISISSDGPVYSVIVAHAGADSLSEVELDPGSQTSVVLLRYLLDRRGVTLNGQPIEHDILSPIQSGRARLLIGDHAIRFRNKFTGAYQYWDLGQEWKRVTELPFVYALWLARPEVDHVTNFAEQLRALRDSNLADLDRIVGNEKEFDPEFCRRYYRDNLRFTFGDQEKRGLREFAKACAELNVIPAEKLELELV